ncbi:NAC domain-containing protein 74-like [Prunus yedoensis var. nudiflora]|uniref:NAC domain-containing protein 74-like n=1 Tax=Prunus yedoensis var. nudiflora TaxID=2094558 RepID=A0A314UX33_PRUYE|nr:NAC domain-containing protein 74-like [Prunus yedoensis var. nudiflora]
MIQELSAQPGEYLDLPFPPPEPPEPGNASVPSPIGNNDSSLPNKNNIIQPIMTVNQLATPPLISRIKLKMKGLQR